MAEEDDALVVMRGNTYSVPFETKYISVKDGNEIALGRTHPGKTISRESGLFPACACSVSGKHAVLKYVDSKFFLTDKSHNGTFVNGKRLVKYEATQLLEKTMEVSLGIKEKDHERVAVFILWALPAGDSDIKYALKLARDFRVECNFYDVPSFNITLELEVMNALVKRRCDVVQKVDDFSFADLQDSSIKDRFLEQIKNVHADEFHLLTVFNHHRGQFEVKYNSLFSDRISHFLLMLSTCNNRTRKFWFLEQESKIWIVKWSYLSDYEKLVVIKHFEINYDKVSDFTELCKYSTVDAQETYFRVPFHEAPWVFNDRTVVIMRGIALVPLPKMVFVVLNKFKQRVLNTMDIFRRHMGQFWGDERLKAVFNFVRKTYESRYEPEYKTRMPKELIASQRVSFPLCMDELQHYLETDNHLHNGGRFQFSLFLKKIGLTMSDSMAYFREYFTKKMSPQNFNKKYGYGIRHIYGQVGRRVSYDPMSCRKILNKVIEPSRHDGCPFKVLSQHKLGIALSRNNISETDADTLWGIVCDAGEGVGPQMACTKYFEIIHSVQYGNEMVDHPNDYFARSRQIIDAQNSTAEGNCHGCPKVSDALSW